MTSACPAAQLPGEVEEPVADTEGLSAVAPADGAAGVCVDALADGPAESLLCDGPPTDPPPSDAWHPARTTATATIRPPAHHRIPAPPGPRTGPPACPDDADESPTPARSADGCSPVEQRHPWLCPARCPSSPAHSAAEAADSRALTSRSSAMSHSLRAPKACGGPPSSRDTTGHTIRNATLPAGARFQGSVARRPLRGTRHAYEPAVCPWRALKTGEPRSTAVRSRALGRCTRAHVPRPEAVRLGERRRSPSRECEFGSRHPLFLQPQSGDLGSVRRVERLTTASWRGFLSPDQCL